MSPRRRQLLRILPLLPAAALAGCGAPPANYYRVAPLPGTIFVTKPAKLQVRDIGVPAYLNESGIAEPSGPYAFSPSANNLWAEPLPGMLQAIIVQELTQRLPRMIVTGSDGTIGEPADLILEIEILRFDPDASGRITLIAQTALKQTADEQFLSANTLQSSAMPAAPDIPSMMAAMSMLLAGLADAVARNVAAIR